MEIFNIGPLELIIVLLIMFVLLGPKEMILTARRIGKWIRSFIRSPMWREIMGYSQEIRDIPQKILDDTGLKEALDEVQQTTREVTTELNTTVNAAIQDARVPEAEHLQIGPIPFSTEPGVVKKEETLALPEEAEKEKDQPLIETSVPAVESETLQLDSALADHEAEFTATLEDSPGQTGDSSIETTPNETITIEAQSVASSTEADEVKTESQKKPRRRAVKSTLVEIAAEDLEEKPVVKPARKASKPRKKASAEAVLDELVQVLAPAAPVEAAQTASTTVGNSGQPDEQSASTDSTQPESNETTIEEQPKPKRRQKRVSLPEAADEPLDDIKPLKKASRSRKKAAVDTESGKSSQSQAPSPDNSVESALVDLVVDDSNKPGDNPVESVDKIAINRQPFEEGITPFKGGLG